MLQYKSNKIWQRTRSWRTNIFSDETLFEPNKYGKYERPKTKHIRKIISDDGEEIEEDPGKDVVYKVSKYGRLRNPQSKLVRRRTTTKNYKNTLNEENNRQEVTVTEATGEKPKEEEPKKDKQYAKENIETEFVNKTGTTEEKPTGDVITDVTVTTEKPTVKY